MIRCIFFTDIKILLFGIIRKSPVKGILKLTPVSLAYTNNTINVFHMTELN